jgi:hypothetical protein
MRPLILPQRSRRQRGFIINPYALAVSGASYTTEVLADSPLLYYRLNTTGATESNLGSAGGTGTFPGSNVTKNATGGPVNGGGYMEISGSMSGFLTGYTTDHTTFTVEVWFNPSAFISSSASPTIIGKRSYFAPGFTDFPWSILYDTSNASVDLNVDSGNDFAIDQTLNGTNTSMPTGSWKHLVCVVRPNNGSNLLEMYLDGALNASVVASTTVCTPNTREIRVGASAESGGGSNNTAGRGKYAEFAFYASALSSARIAAHWAARNTA